MNNFAKGFILTVLEFSTWVLQNVLHINFGLFIELIRAYFLWNLQTVLQMPYFSLWHCSMWWHWFLERFAGQAMIHFFLFILFNGLFLHQFGCTHSCIPALSCFWSRLCLQPADMLAPTYLRKQPWTPKIQCSKWTAVITKTGRTTSDLSQICFLV